MLLLTRRSLFSLRTFSTATPARTSQTAFPFLPVNTLAVKPDRNKGITEIRGPYYHPVTRTYLDELLSDWGEYVDGIKFAGGSFSLMPEKRLRDLIEVAHKHGALGFIFVSHITTRRFPCRRDLPYQTATLVLEAMSNASWLPLPETRASSPSTSASARTLALTCSNSPPASCPSPLMTGLHSFSSPRPMA